MKIKAILIHLLGGITQDESKSNETKEFFIGQWNGLQELKQYADSLNGINADDWSKAVYRRIEEKIEEADRMSHLE